MLYYSSYEKKLQEIIFEKLESIPCDEFIVLSGYLGPKPIEYLLENGIKTKIIFGLASEGVDRAFHEKLISYVNDSVEILVPSTPSHAKFYIWRKSGKIQYILNGSANFSHKGLNSPYREVLNEVNTYAFPDFETYFSNIFESCIPYQRFEDEKNQENEAYGAKKEEFCISGSLWAKGSKINWGHAPKGHTNPRDSYIPITTEMRKNFPSLFPEKSQLKGLGFADNEPIEIIWDDGMTMAGLLEGTIYTHKGTPSEKRYPNKISSYPSKKILGDYLRGRMGISSGEYVTKEAFIKYGRENVLIKKISESLYFFDFSVSSA